MEGLKMGIVTAEERKNEINDFVRRRSELISYLKYEGAMTFKHFKGNFYEVLAVSTHTETREELVVYRNKYLDKDRIWTRPIEMFLSYIEEKDKEKYPYTKYRLTATYELELTDEQIKKYDDLRSRLMDGENMFAKCVDGHIFKVIHTSLMEKYRYIRLLDVVNINTAMISDGFTIYAGELFSENFEVVKGEELNANDIIQAAQLSEQIHGFDGRF